MVSSKLVYGDKAFYVQIISRWQLAGGSLLAIL